jgi:hypothetical protein
MNNGKISKNISPNKLDRIKIGNFRPEDEERLLSLDPLDLPTQYAIRIVPRPSNGTIP